MTDDEFGNVEKIIVTYMAIVREVEMSAHASGKHKTVEVFGAYLN